MQHPSTTVLHETFADPFYFGPDAKVREEDKAADDAIESSGLARDKTYAGVVEEIMGAMSDGKRGERGLEAACAFVCGRVLLLIPPPSPLPPPPSLH
jgi:hypothetical protein